MIGIRWIGMRQQLRFLKISGTLGLIVLSCLSAGRPAALSPDSVSSSLISDTQPQLRAGLPALFSLETAASQGGPSVVILTGSVSKDDQQRLPLPDAERAGGVVEDTITTGIADLLVSSHSLEPRMALFAVQTLAD